jgi:DnaJ-class molecular chaperone
MDYYNILGVNKNATQDEIKKAYRKLASQHHPDKGGDKSKFQEIQGAYDTLGDPEKRNQYDNPVPQGFNQFGGFPPGFEDIFSHFGGGGSPFGDIFGRQQHRPPQRNRTLNLQTTISLEDAFSGKDMVASITLPSGLEQVLEVKIPAGVREGTVLRLAGMGDDTYQNIPRGDLHLTINIEPHRIYQRQGDDLLRQISISCFDAILGKTLTFETIDNKTLEIMIKAGTQHGQILAVQGYGMPYMGDQRMKGRLLIEIKVSVPTNLTEDQKDLIKQLVS